MKKVDSGSTWYVHSHVFISSSSIPLVSCISEAKATSAFFFFSFTLLTNITSWLQFPFLISLQSLFPHSLLPQILYPSLSLQERSGLPGRSTKHGFSNSQKNHMKQSLPIKNVWGNSQEERDKKKMQSKESKTDLTTNLRGPIRTSSCTSIKYIQKAFRRFMQTLLLSSQSLWGYIGPG